MTVFAVCNLVGPYVGYVPESFFFGLWNSDSYSPIFDSYLIWCQIFIKNFVKIEPSSRNE